MPLGFVTYRVEEQSICAGMTRQNILLQLKGIPKTRETQI